MLLMAASFAITFTPEYYSFVVLQFIIGAGCLGTWMAAFVAGMFRNPEYYRFAMICSQLKSCPLLYMLSANRSMF